VLQLLLPTRCAVCDEVGPSPCSPCIAQLRPAQRFPVPSALTSCVALFMYEGPVRRLITGLKYRNQRGALDRLAAALAIVAVNDVDAITWAPTSTERRRARGFDQAELLARAIARRLRRPCVRTLRRVAGLSQTGQPLAVRVCGPAFEPTRPAPPSLLLVDDVVTTGATLAAGARALRRAGANEIHGAVVAHTPERGRG